MPTRTQIVAAARQYLGVPFHHQGRSKAGVDCLGLLVCVAKDLGLAPPDGSGYARRPDHNLVRQSLNKHLTRVVGPYQAADILLFSFHGATLHMGLATDMGMIHACGVSRKVVEHSIDEIWQKRIVFAYQFPEVTDTCNYS